MKLDGYKTYLTALALICYAIGGFFSGNIELTNAVMILLNGLGLGSLKHAVSK